MSELNGSSMVRAYVSEYLDGTLSETKKNEVQNAIEKEGMSTWVDDFAIHKGQLQDCSTKSPS